MDAEVIASLIERQRALAAILAESRTVTPVTPVTPATWQRVSLIAQASRPAKAAAVALCCALAGCAPLTDREKHVGALVVGVVLAGVILSQGHGSPAQFEPHKNPGPGRPPL